MLQQRFIASPCWTRASLVPSLFPFPRAKDLLGGGGRDVDAGIFGACVAMAMAVARRGDPDHEVRACGGHKAELRTAHDERDEVSIRVELDLHGERA